MIIKTTSEAKPALWESNHWVVVATKRGARNAVTEPDRPYRPKNWVAFSGGQIFAIKVREADNAVTKNKANT